MSMKKQLAVALSIAVTGVVSAANIERTSQSVGILFEVGRYAEFSIGSASPSVSGVAVAGTPGVSSGNMASDYSSVSLGYKQSIGNNFDVALIIDEPVGANVKYPGGNGYLIGGSTATLDSTAITGLIKYKYPNNVSVYGGIRSQSLGGKVHLEQLGSPSYDLTVGQKHELGYVAGFAYEKPEIALRAALTYNSEIKHDFGDVLEQGGASLPFSSTIPQSVNLEFQSGVAKDTLVFGSIRWVEWSKFNIAPYGYGLATGGSSLVDYGNDSTAYNIGVGRKLNDKWSAAVSLGYEPSTAGTCNRTPPATGCTGNLGPTDGSKSIGIGVSYKMKKAKITAGVRYVKVGDAQTSFADFKDNSAVGFGVKVGYNF